MLDLMAGRPYLYHFTTALSKGHGLVMSIVRKELDKAGYENPSKPSAWEQFAFDDDTLVVVTAVPVSDGRTYVHVIATSNSGDAAERGARDVMKRIKASKMVLLD
jgi:hypothetical protein